jgi:hypothetical protein
MNETLRNVKLREKIVVVEKFLDVSHNLVKFYVLPKY